MVVEVTKRYVTNIPSIDEALSFAARYLDKVPNAPSIVITPYWSMGEDGEGILGFTVIVEGMAEEEEEKVEYEDLNSST